MTDLSLPLFPLNAVLYPEGHLPLRVFEPRYLDMICRCLKGNTPFGVVLIRRGKEVGEAADPHAVGTTAAIRDWDRGEDGLLTIVAEGVARFRILEREVRPDRLSVARVEILPEPQEEPVPFALRSLALGLERILGDLGERYPGPYRLDDSAWVADRLAEILPFPLGVRQDLLEMDDPAQRLEHISDWIAAHQEPD
jgi:Lon protease-like protein